MNKWLKNRRDLRKKMMIYSCKWLKIKRMMMIKVVKEFKKIYKEWEVIYKNNNF